MINTLPADIYNEYTSGIDFKNSIGEKGLYDQSDINERFYVGDQWYGANCGNTRPLVRHNVIKRIADYKLSRVLDSAVNIEYSVDGISKPFPANGKNLKKRLSGFKYTGNPANDEINAVSEAMKNFFEVTSKRLNFQNICAKALKNAYISGTGIIYTYWDSSVNTGLYKNDVAVKGDIKCEVLDIKNVYFGNPYRSSPEEQPFIIIASAKSPEEVLAEAVKFGADEYTLKNIKSSGNSDITVLTKLYKEKDGEGKERVMCVKVTENATVRPPFDTGLRKYPIAVFRWDERGSLIYGESEITHIIPNQIAINRMITANVWSTITSGLPMMVINGDTVTEDITNDPGQIIKIYGSNEDVAGAVNYVSPPDVSSSFDATVNTLINNTLTQCGANEVALGDSRADNTSALNVMISAATMPLNMVKDRFYGFIEETALIWLDFWITQYGKRKIKITDENGVWYMPFNSERYKDLFFVCNAYAVAQPKTDSDRSINLLNSLLDKGVITKKQYFSRLPKGLIPNVEEFLNEKEDDKETDKEKGENL